jgi:hypothetical protein
MGRGPKKECKRVIDESAVDSVPDASARVQTDAEEEPHQGSAMSDRIGVGGGDENVAKIQLAARWAEQYAPESGDTLDDALRRFKRAYNYVDSVSKLVDPDEAI